MELNFVFRHQFHQICLICSQKINVNSFEKLKVTPNKIYDDPVLAVVLILKKKGCYDPSFIAAGTQMKKNKLEYGKHPVTDVFYPKLKKKFSSISNRYSVLKIEVLKIFGGRKHSISSKEVKNLMK